VEIIRPFSSMAYWTSHLHFILCDAIPSPGEWLQDTSGLDEVICWVLVLETGRLNWEKLPLTL